MMGAAKVTRLLLEDELRRRDGSGCERRRTGLVLVVPNPRFVSLHRARAALVWSGGKGRQEAGAAQTLSGWYRY